MYAAQMPLFDTELREMEPTESLLDRIREAATSQLANFGLPDDVWKEILSIEKDYLEAWHGTDQWFQDLEELEKRWGRFSTPRFSLQERRCEMPLNLNMSFAAKVLTLLEQAFNVKLSNPYENRSYPAAAFLKQETSARDLVSNFQNELGGDWVACGLEQEHQRFLDNALRNESRITGKSVVVFGFVYWEEWVGVRRISFKGWKHDLTILTQALCRFMEDRREEQPLFDYHTIREISPGEEIEAFGCCLRFQANGGVRITFPDKARARSFWETWVSP